MVGKSQKGWGASFFLIRVVCSSCFSCHCMGDGPFCHCNYENKLVYSCSSLHFGIMFDSQVKLGTILMLISHFGASSPFGQLPFTCFSLSCHLLIISSSLIFFKTTSANRVFVTYFSDICSYFADVHSLNIFLCILCRHQFVICSTLLKEKKTLEWRHQLLPLDPASFQSRFLFFLDVPSHLYKRLCPSVRRSVGPSVRPPTVCPVLFSDAY